MNFHEKKGGMGNPCRFSPLTAFMLNNRFRRFLQNPEKILAGYIREGVTVMDIGCGPGMVPIPLAKMVGSSGKVIAVDIQPEMLDIVRKKSENLDLASRITFYRNFPDSLGLTEQADFILSFWMVHEEPDQVRFFKEVRGLLKPGGKYLMVEPVIEVREPAFRESVERARRSGIALMGSPKVSLSRSALFSVSNG